MAGFPDDILQQLGLAFQPIQDAFSDPSGKKLQALLANFGWTFDPSQGISGTGLDSFASLVGTVISDIKNDDYSNLPQQVPGLISALQALGNPASTLAPFSSSDFWSGTTYTDSSGQTTPGPSFVDDLLGYLVCSYVQQQVPLAYGLLRFIGVFSTTQLAGGSRQFRHWRSRARRLYAAGARRDEAAFGLFAAAKCLFVCL
jgi:hypothetical protein